MDIISNSDYILTLISNTKDIKRNLNNSIYSELHINYNQGNRDGDYILKEKVEYINIEVEQYYSTIELFENARVADSKQFYQEILSFFKTHYLEEFLLQDKLHNLSSELSKQDLQDIEFNRKNQDSSYHRNPKNIIREELKKELEIFEKAFNQDVIPKLLSFLSLVNILYFYEVLKELITRSILDDKRLFLNELPSYLKSYIDNEIKISKINYSAEDISQHITKKIKEFKFIDLLEKNNLTNTHELSLLIHDFANKNFKQKKRSASETNTIAQQQNEKELIYNEIFSLLECLCIKGFGTKSKKIHELTLMKPYRKFVDLKNNKKMRFLFHVPSKSHKSLLDISEKLVDFLIFYNEFFKRI